MSQSIIEQDARTQSSGADTKPVSSAAFWGGWVISGLPAAFLLMDGVMKLFKPKPVIEGTVQLGFSESVIVPLGITLICCVVLYLIPRTAVLGAILLTGYLGGAVASQVRVGHPFFADILAPVYVAIFVWTGLCLRDRRMRALAPLRSLPKGRENPTPPPSSAKKKTSRQSAKQLSENERMAMYSEFHRFLNTHAMIEAASRGLTEQWGLDYALTKASEHIERSYSISFEQWTAIFKEGQSKNWDKWP